jgi:hypothetical protein
MGCRAIVQYMQMMCSDQVRVTGFSVTPDIYH